MNSTYVFTYSDSIIDHEFIDAKEFESLSSIVFERNFRYLHMYNKLNQDQDQDSKKLSCVKTLRVHNVDTYKYLLECGIDIMSQSYFIIKGCIIIMSQSGSVDNECSQIIDFFLEIDKDHVLGIYHLLAFTTARNNLQMVKKFVESGIDIHENSEYALRTACEYGYLEIVAYLVDCGADYRVLDNSAINNASKEGHLEVVKYLIQHGADPKHAFKVALCYGQLQIVKFIIQYDYKILDQVDDSYFYGAIVNNKQMMEYLIGCRPSRQILNQILLYAVECDYITITRLALESGADVNTIDKSSIEYVCANGFVEMLQLLFDTGFDLRSNEANYLDVACCYNSISVVKFFVDIGADIHFDNNRCVKTACKMGYLKLVKFIIGCGVDVRLEDNLLIKIASASDKLDLVEYLTSQGASFNT